MKEFLSIRIVPIMILSLGSTSSFAQHPVVEQIIASISIDSMMKYVREISGEFPIDIGNGPEFIMSRNTFHPGNEKAQLFLQQKFEGFGYSVEMQTFSSTGRNLIVTKPGTIATADPLILCAHYDAMPGGIYNAPGADDDGSGTAAVLEAARILADVQFEHPIIFALWDEEEQGLVGSGLYAGAIAANDVELRAVINMDAIAYDGNADAKARIHSRPIGNSHEIADSIFSVRSLYDIDLDLILTVPGAGYSDHASFWNEGYGAVLVIEEFSADGNPFYHSANDRAEHFDVPYYEKLARLSIATLATMAVPVMDGTWVGDHVAPFTSIQVYPDPASTTTDLWINTSISERIVVSVIGLDGRELLPVYEGVLAAGRHSFRLDLSSLAPGNYIILALGRSGPSSVKLVKLP